MTQHTAGRPSPIRPSRGRLPVAGPASPHPARRPPLAPWALFFPLGLVLAWSGVGHWLLHALGWLPEYRSVFHSIVQIQGFMLSFAAGFLFTVMPRQSGLPGPGRVEAGIVLVALPSLAIAAWIERIAVSQLLFLVVLCVLLNFALRCLSRGPGRPPASFGWVPVALGMGIVGSLLASSTPLLKPSQFWIHDLGKILTLQGMLLGLVIGVGGTLLPVLTLGEPPHLRPPVPRPLAAAIAIALIASFPIEVIGSERNGLALRALALLAWLVTGPRLHRLPRLRGLHRRLAWLAVWLMPAGYVLAAAFPLAIRGALHVTFVGGFALLTLCVSANLVLGHAGAGTRLEGHDPAVVAFGGLLLGAALLRALADFDRPRFLLWVGAASACFLAGTLAWAALTFPRLRPPSRAA